jgi:hypothetical protein
MFSSTNTPPTGAHAVDPRPPSAGARYSGQRGAAGRRRQHTRHGQDTDMEAPVCQ